VVERRQWSDLEAVNRLRIPMKGDMRPWEIALTRLVRAPGRLMKGDLRQGDEERLWSETCPRAW
jgi:hypothetical protein